jgi:hypothetical protein
MPFRFFRQQVGNDRAEQTKKSHGCEIFLVRVGRVESKTHIAEKSLKSADYSE